VFDIASLQVDSPLSYLIAFGFPLLDAVLPIVPSESLVIALGVATAGSSDPRIFLLVAVAALGAFAGDNMSYYIGRRFGPWATRRFFKGDKGAARQDWAERSLERYGMGLIIACRFIPGGRTAVTLSCGIIRYPWRKFCVATMIAAIIWATYAFLAGRIGGKAFENQPLIGFAIAFGGAVVISAMIELGRRGVARLRVRSRDVAGEQPPQTGRPGARRRSGKAS
jgi:membrane protein DedA with SNARE-associated domain